jgi:hypothetical protein
MDRAAFLAIAASLAACPEPRAGKKSSSGVAPIDVTAAPTESYRADAPEDPYPVDLRAFPSPAHESWGMFRAEVRCDFLGQTKDYVNYAKDGLECWGYWKCAGTDDVARPFDCAAIASHATCTSVNPPEYVSPLAPCERARKSLKPRVAARYATCLAAQLDDYACFGDVERACREHALFSACPDASADATCHAIGEACPSITLEACRPYVSGLTAQGREKVAQCMKFKINCEKGIASCIDRLGQFD